MEVARHICHILIFIYIYIAIYPNKQMYNTLGSPPTQKYIGEGYLAIIYRALYIPGGAGCFSINSTTKLSESVTSMNLIQSSTQSCHESWSFSGWLQWVQNDLLIQPCQHLLLHLFTSLCFIKDWFRCTWWFCFLPSFGVFPCLIS